jgi:repressor LexA
MTPVQKEVLLTVHKFIEEKGMSPTYQEISSLRGCDAKSSSFAQIKALIDKGYIKKVEGRLRSIEITKHGKDYIHKYG